MPHELLPAAAVALLSPHLKVAGANRSRETIEQAAGANNELLAWLRERLIGAGKRALAELEADPDSTDSQAALRQQIAKLLATSPLLRADLEALIASEKFDVTDTVQRASGDGTKGTQIRRNSDPATPPDAPDVPPVPRFPRVPRGPGGPGGGRDD